MPRRQHAFYARRTAMTAFALIERDIWPGCREMHIEGELDLAVSERLRAALERATEERHHVLVDLSRCDFIDTVALAVLVHGHRHLREHGHQLLLYGVQGQVRRLLSVASLTETGLMATTAGPGALGLWSDRLRSGATERVRVGTT
jgi:anti-anti-sigma factor